MKLFVVALIFLAGDVVTQGCSFNDLFWREMDKFLLDGDCEDRAWENETARDGELCSVECLPGFVPEDSNTVHTVRCTDGVWTNTTLKCLPNTCGDGIKSGHEKCDHLDLGGATCQSTGYDEGIVLCSENCKLDVSNCIKYVKCGDKNLPSGNYKLILPEPTNVTLRYFGHSTFYKFEPKSSEGVRRGTYSLQAGTYQLESPKIFFPSSEAYVDIFCNACDIRDLSVRTNSSRVSYRRNNGGDRQQFNPDVDYDFSSGEGVWVGCQPEYWWSPPEISSTHTCVNSKWEEPIAVLETCPVCDPSKLNASSHFHYSYRSRATNSWHPNPWQAITNLSSRVYEFHDEICVSCEPKCSGQVLEFICSFGHFNKIGRELKCPVAVPEEAKVPQEETHDEAMTWQPLEVMPLEAMPLEAIPMEAVPLDTDADVDDDGIASGASAEDLQRLFRPLKPL